MDPLTLTDSGLFCEAGGFHIDPWKPVARAVITHAHSDHARAGSQTYLCARAGAEALRLRMGADAMIQTLEYGEEIDIKGVRVSLHPAGHVVGSAQVRVEHQSRVTVVSGDYKIDADPTCQPFEPVRCETFITESTFGLPIFRWPRPAAVFEDINDWWRGNQNEKVTSIVFAYSLGKAQRVLAGVDASIGPILAHGAVLRMIEAYRSAGVNLPDVLPATPEHVKAHRGATLVVAPPSAANSPWLRKFGDQSHASASGWMQIRGNRRRRNLDRGFVLSDHADWPGLLHAIDATGASRIGVTHGSTDAFARFLREQGRDAFVIKTRFSDTGEEPAETENAATIDRASENEMFGD